MVMDPSTGKMVTAPEYGGTLTIASKNELLDHDPSIAADTGPAFRSWG